MLAMLMIRGADPTKYGSLIAEDLSNQFVKNKDEYPKNMADAETMLELYKPPINQPTNNRVGRGHCAGATNNNNPTPEASAATFAQSNTPRLSYEERVAQSVPGSDGVLHAGITCRACRGYGHYSDTCPGTNAGAEGSTTTTGTTLTQYAFVLAQSSDSGIDSNWILRGSQSTISVFCNHTMLSNIRQASTL
jgi:hypothetical protein